jgi:Tfp pilus assembly protein PilN
MKQQINLVNPALLPAKPFFQLHRMALALLALALALLLTWALLRPAVLSHEAAAATANARLATREAQVKTLEQQVSQRRPDPRHASAIAAAQQIRQALLEMAQQLEPESQPVYSAYLRGLGETGMKDVWLRAIEFEGERIELKGLTLRATVLPEYLEALNRQTVFRGMRFDGFDISQEAAGVNGAPQALGFRLQSLDLERQP